MPKVKDGIATHKVHDLKKCPLMVGKIHPIRIGNPNPIRNPKSRSCFLEIELFILNPIQIPVSMFDLYSSKFVHSLEVFDFGEQEYPFLFS